MLAFDSSAVTCAPWHRLVELVTLGGRDVDEDLLPVAQLLVEVGQVALVAAACEVARVAHGELARVVHRVLHEVGDLRVLEAARRLLEALLLLVEEAHVLEVAEELPVRQRRLHDRRDLRVELRLVVADVLQELEERLFLVRRP